MAVVRVFAAVLLGAAAVAVSASYFSGIGGKFGRCEAYTEVFTKTFTANEAGLLQATTPSGSISVTSWDKPAIALTATKRVRTWHNATDAADLLNQIDVAVGEGGAASIIGSAPRNSWITSFSVDYELKVPRGAGLYLQTNQGGIAVEEVMGVIRAKAIGGDIVLTDVGPTVARATDGGAHINHVVGDCSVYASGGDISIARVNGTLTAENLDGNITWIVAPDDAYAVEAHAIEGKVELAVEVDSAERPTSDHIRGTINGGGPAATFKTTQGDITINPIWSPGGKLAKGVPHR